MTRVVVVAADRVGARMAGPGIRALEIAGALADAGIAVTLAAPETGPDDVGVAAIDYEREPDRLRRAVANADALVVGGAGLARLPLLAESDLPIVVDLYAPDLLEGLSAVRAGGPAAAGRAERFAADLDVVRLHLRRGDFFLCASEVQRDFWIGMLAALGRVSPETHGRDPTLRGLIDVVPFGLPDTPPVAPPSPVLRGVWPGIAHDARIALWGGGLWDWLDPVTLVRAAGLLSARRPELQVVFLATASPSANVPVMAAEKAARRAAEEGGLLGRSVHFGGAWVPYRDRAAHLLEADLGVSLHLPHVESRYAFRTRLLDCFWTGLPVVVSGGDVLADLVAEQGLGRVVAPGRADAAAEAIDDLLALPGGREALADRFPEVRAAYRWPRVVAPLAAFLEAPQRAADRPSVAVDLTATPWWRLPGRALAAARRGGPSALLRESRDYLRWRRRPR